MLKKPFHHILFAVYPVIALLSNNIGEITVTAAIRPLLILAVIAGVVHLLLNVVLRNWHRSALVTSGFMLWFLTYGFFFKWVGGQPFTPALRQMGLNLLFHRHALMVWTGLFFIIILLAITRKELVSVTSAVNLMILVTLGLALVQTAWKLASIDRDITVESITTPSTISTLPNTSLPDIYYIILDGHGRTDTLATYYDYDLTPFTNELEEMGFYVAEKSNTNYARTALSLLSTFNYNHLTDLSDKLSGVSLELWQATESSLFYNRLKEAGYTTIAISTGHFVDFQSYDYVFFSVPNAITHFESILLQSSIIHIWSTRLSNQHAVNVQTGLARMTDLPPSRNPRFIFSHIIIPHPPFIFDESGNVVSDQLDLNDGNYFAGTAEEYYDGYRAQIAYTNSVMLDIIKEILDSAATPPIIIIQGDHGPGRLFHYTDIEKACMNERYPILNAYYFPDGDYTDLYPTITPVNTFRVISNNLFGTTLELEEDRSYYSTETALFDFIDITDMIESQDCSHLDTRN